MNAELIQRKRKWDNAEKELRAAGKRLSVAEIELKTARENADQARLDYEESEKKGSA